MKDECLLYNIMWKSTDKIIEFRVFEHVESEEPENLSSFLETLLGKCPQN